MELTDQILPDGRLLAEVRWQSFMSIASDMAKSATLPAWMRTPQTAAMVIGLCLPLGLTAEEAVHSVYFIEDRKGNPLPQLYAKKKYAIAYQRAGVRIYEEGYDPAQGLFHSTLTRGAEQRTGIFTLDMAVQYGLMKRDASGAYLGLTPAWSRDPQYMLRIRARGRALDDLCPDLFAGFCGSDDEELSAWTSGSRLRPQTDMPPADLSALGPAPDLSEQLPPAPPSPQGTPF